MEDVHRVLATTGVDGVMVSEAILDNPAFFSGTRPDAIELGAELLHFFAKYGGDRGWIRPHLFKILHQK